MALVNLNTFAGILATYARSKLSEVHRAALLVRCTQDGSVLAAVFGNDNYIGSNQTRREVELVRRQLKDTAMEELAFGLSHDGHSWALLVKADTRGVQTDLGKAFRTEMLRVYLDDLVWAAWRTVSGAPASETRWPEMAVAPKTSA
jgi:hypothetical protein